MACVLVVVYTLVGEAYHRGLLSSAQQRSPPLEACGGVALELEAYGDQQMKGW